MSEDTGTKSATLTGNTLTPEEVKKRNERNLAIALALGVFIILVFVITLLRLSASIADKAI